jgi:hypothetical protein
MARMSSLDTAAIDQDGDIMPVSQDIPDKRLDSISGSEISGVDEGFAAETFDLLLCFLIGCVSLKGGQLTRRENE